MRWSARFIDFATHLMKEGQKGEEYLQQAGRALAVMKQHGRPKLLNTSDLPKFVETVRPIYEDAELTRLFDACTPTEEGQFQVLSHVGIRAMPKVAS